MGSQPGGLVRRLRSRSFRSLVILGISGACGRAPVPELAECRWALERGLAASPRVDVVLPDAETAGRFRARFPARLAPAGPELRFLAPEDPGDPAAARIVLGGAANAEAAALAARVGVEPLPAGGFAWRSREFSGAGDALSAVLEDPEHAGRPLSLWYANAPEDLELYVRDLRPRARPWLRIWRDGELVLECPLAADGTPRDEAAIDRWPALTETVAHTRTVGAAGFTTCLVGEVEPRRLRSYGKAVLAARARVLGWFGTGGEAPLSLVVYGRPADLVQVTGEEAISLANPIGPRVHAVLAWGVPDDGGEAVARATAIAAGGTPAAEWLLDGIGVCAAGTWWSRPLPAWVGTLELAGMVPPIAEIVDPAASERLSPHLLQPLRGFLVQTLLEARGPARMRGLWSGAVPFTVDRLFLLAWRRALQRAAAVAAPGATERSARRRARILSAPLRHGVALLEAASGEVSGYLEERTAESLRRAAALGADAVTLAVLAASEPGAAAGPWGGRRPLWSSTSDLALARAAAAARALGLSTTLVLEPLASPSGPRLDGPPLLAEADWDAFFADLRPLALHYGLLAELLFADVLCLGTELGLADRTAEGDPAAPEAALQGRRREGWKALIAEVRRVFGGALTYGAASVLDAEAVGFWEDLDFVGVLLYPEWPVAAEGPPSDERIRGTYRHLLQRAVEIGQARGRPCLVLQAGFPSAADSWERSWVPAGPADPESQRRVLGLLAAALANGGLGHPGLAGLTLWGWSSDPEAGGEGDRGFTPQNKAAEEVLPLLFGKAR
ncbi:MAG: hypothetical protein AB1726_16870 [Planctomycetota bacterium]